MTWSKENYFAKASVFWGKATGHPRDSVDYFLNFAFFLEHVVRGAIVSYNPVLNAASRDEESLLYSVGINPRVAPKTIELSKAVSYLQRLIPEISKEEATALGVLVDFRNTELHDDRSQFDLEVLQRAIPDCQVLVLRSIEFAQEAPETVIGKDDAAQFEANRKAKTSDRERRVKSLIETCKDRFYHLSKEEQDARREAGKLSFATAVTTSGRHVRLEKCPSCSGLGVLSGIPYGQSTPMLSDDDLVVEVRVQPDAFDCKICGLSMRGLDELLSAKFPHEFTSIDTVDVVEHFGVDPMEYVDTEEIVRTYYDEGYGYQDE